MRKRSTLATAVATLAVALSATPASAITGGQPDPGHPYVGMLQTHDAHGVPLQVCSGTLVSRTVFLTAAHCVLKPHAARGTVWFQQTPPFDLDYLIALFFDPNFDGSCFYSPKFDLYPCKGDGTGEPHAIAGACFDCATGLPKAVTRDVAVIKLDAPVPASVVPRTADLPGPRAVDKLANMTGVDIVGYGVHDQVDIADKFAPGPPPFFRWSGSGARRLGRSRLVSGNFAHSDEFVKLTANAAKEGGGGLCFGDSGGPGLLGDTDTVLAVSSYVTDYNCSGVTYSQRVDVPAVRDWITSFMP
jgi:secreted trypsin-like serine protease